MSKCITIYPFIHSINIIWILPCTENPAKYHTRHWGKNEKCRSDPWPYGALGLVAGGGGE